eukprot:SAG11_NODE_542_length_8640_cov_5.667603_10_plen_144_part_00
MWPPPPPPKPVEPRPDPLHPCVYVGITLLFVVTLEAQFLLTLPEYSVLRARGLPPAFTAGRDRGGERDRGGLVSEHELELDIDGGGVIGEEEHELKAGPPSRLLGLGEVLYEELLSYAEHQLLWALLGKRALADAMWWCRISG